MKVRLNEKLAANDELIDLKFERMAAYIDASLYKCKTQILKWVIALSIAESFINLALRLGGM